MDIHKYLHASDFLWKNLTQKLGLGGGGQILWYFFVLQQEALGSSLVAKGIWGNSVLTKVSHVSFQVVKGNLGLLLCRCSEIHLIFGWGWIFWFFSSCGRKLEFPLKLPLEFRGSSRVVMGISGNHSSCPRGVRPPFLLWGGTWDSSRGSAGDLSLISSCSGELGFPLKL